MHSDDTPTPKITTVDEAVEALLEWQESEGGIRTIPASGDTIETEAGWAFFNLNGYLGTVTPEGVVIEEAQFEVDDE